MSLYETHEAAGRKVLDDADTLIAALDAAKVRLTADLAAAETERQRVSAELAAARTEIDDLSDTLAGAQQENDTLQGTLATVQAQRAALQAQVTAHEATIVTLRARIAELEGPQPDPEPERVTAGALPVGSATYPVPTSGPVMFVSTTGNDSNPGTLASPKRTVVAASHAIKSQGTATLPATVVIRAGVYHEGGYQPGNGYHLRWQAYPGEAVWLDGSVVASTWTATGSGTWWTSYNAPTGFPTPDANNRVGNDILMDDKNAYLPDMAFVDGVELLQVADGATPTAGQFSVDRTANRLYIGTNPSGKEVRYSDLVFVTTSGSRIDLLGLGFRRYRCVGNVLHTALYFKGTAVDTTIENCIFDQMGRNALYVGRDRARVTSSSFTRLNQTGLLVGDSDGVIVERNVFFDTIRGKWQPQPTSGALKVTAARRCHVRHNRFGASHKGNQIWLDVYVTESFVYGNDIDGTSVDGTTTSDTGICYEESDGGLWSGVQYRSLIVGNTVVNCRKGIVVQSAGWVTVSNNTISTKWSSGPQSILLIQDRDASDQRVSGISLQTSPRWCVNNEILNNRVRPQQGGWQFLAWDDQQYTPRQTAIANGLGSPDKGTLAGGEMFSRLAGNWFSPANGNGGNSTMALIGRPQDTTRLSFNTPAALAVTNTEYRLSSANVGTNYQSATDPTTAADHATGEPIRADIAALLGVPVGTRYVGNPLPAPVLVAQS